MKSIKFYTKIIFATAVFTSSLFMANLSAQGACPKSMPINQWMKCYGSQKIGINLKNFSTVDMDKGANDHAATYVLKLKNSSGDLAKVSYCANNWITIEFKDACESEANICGMKNSGFSILKKQFDGKGALVKQVKNKCSAKAPADSKCCSNGAINPTSGCNQCSAGMLWDSVQKKCYSQCSSGQTYSNGSCVTSSCPNGAIDAPYCKICQGNIQLTDSSQVCPRTCNFTNACGQTSLGNVDSRGQCVPVDTVNNNTCITQFNVSTDSVNPNGSVNFEWRIADLPTDVEQKCGFVDLTTPTPRPIPGLQNLDPKRNSATINNIQSTTRFCLVCQFYKNNLNIGEAVAHQWVRVIRIGEN